MSSTGNITNIHKDSDWKVGKFMTNKDFYSETCEVKYSNFKKGYKRNWHKSDGKCLSILISGKFKINFEGKEIIINEEGDFITHGNEIHKYEALEDSKIICIRWFK